MQMPSNDLWITSLGHPTHRLCLHLLGVTHNRDGQSHSITWRPTSRHALMLQGFVKKCASAQTARVGSQLHDTLKYLLVAMPYTVRQTFSSSHEDWQLHLQHEVFHRNCHASRWQMRSRPQAASKCCSVAQVAEREPWGTRGFDECASVASSFICFLDWAWLVSCFLDCHDQFWIRVRITTKVTDQ